MSFGIKGKRYLKESFQDTLAKAIRGWWKYHLRNIIYIALLSEFNYQPTLINTGITQILDLKCRDICRFMKKKFQTQFS